MTKEQLTHQIFTKKSFLCIGLDVNLDKVPPHLLTTDDPIFEFNKQIIDATHDLVVAYKPNTAFYESYGLSGWQSLEKTIAYLNTTYPDILTIADAKRADIGNTASRYADAFFKNLKFDALTVSPYMGKDSIVPFLNYKDKFTILLALTSNPGATDFQMQSGGEMFLYEQVITKSLQWQGSSQLMFVVGATNPEYFQRIRQLVPEHFLLVPGVGTQGGDLESVCKNGLNDEVGLIVNVSRAIIYAGNTIDFAEKARIKAIELQQQMQKIMAIYLK